MIPLVVVHDGFEARVLAARLGSEGIVTQFRGSVEGPYPMGRIELLVPEAEFDTAREILLADEVEAAFEDAEIIDPGRTLSGWAVALVVVCVVAVAVVSVAARV